MTPAYAAPFGPEKSLRHEALVFATIFRREAHRTSVVQSAVVKLLTIIPGVGQPGNTSTIVSVHQAASHPGMEGYDVWAATAINKYLDHAKLTKDQMVRIASALTRAPMCEVAWAEAQLSNGVLPWNSANEYDATARKFENVRPWPRKMETTDQTYVEMLSALVGKAKQTRHHDPSKGPIDPVGLLLVDEPWVTPREVLNDPAYAGPIPPADLHGKVIEWDTDGLLSRVEHEMLVVGASFSEQIDRVLRQQDGSLSGPVPGGGMVGEVESYLDKGDGPNGPFLMGTIIGLTAGASSYWKKQDAPVALAWTAGAGGLMYLIWKYLAEPSIARATDLDPTTRPSAKKVDK